MTLSFFFYFIYLLLFILFFILVSLAELQNLYLGEYLFELAVT